MKYILLVSLVCSCLGGISSVAAADATNRSLPTVNVNDASRRQIDCTPPNDLQDCAALHAQIRANFSPSEINMLFGSATASKEYPTSYAEMRRRYNKVLSDFQDGRQVAVIAVGNPTPVPSP